MTLGAKLVTHGHNRIRLLKKFLYLGVQIFDFFFFLVFFISIVTFNLKARIISQFETSPKDSWILSCNYLNFAIFDNFPILPPNFVLDTN